MSSGLLGVEQDEESNMALLDILPSLESLTPYRDLIESLTHKRRSTGQIISNGLPYLISCLRKELSVPIIVLVPKPDDSRRLLDQLISWHADDGSILHFPESDVTSIRKASFW